MYWHRYTAQVSFFFGLVAPLSRGYTTNSQLRSPYPPSRHFRDSPNMLLPRINLILFNCCESQVPTGGVCDTKRPWAVLYNHHVADPLPEDMYGLTTAEKNAVSLLPTDLNILKCGGNTISVTGMSIQYISIIQHP